MKRLLILCLAIIFTSSLFSTNYYISTTGSDLNDGKSPAQAWASFVKLQSVVINPGDSILLKSADVFSTTQTIKLWKWIYIGADNTYGTGDDVAYGNVPVSSPANNIVVTTYPVSGSPAIINFTKDTNGVELYNVQGVKVMNLTLSGIGYGGKPKYSGVSVYNEDSYGLPLTDTLKGYTIDKVIVSGFKYGIFIGSWSGRKSSGFSILNCVSHDNFIGGISVYAQQSGDISNVTVQKCKAYNNAGDQNAGVNTGSGIVIGDVFNALIDHCVAYNNGSQCTANDGPYGIWTYNSSNVTIQHCESYNNKTGGAADGGGFDLDGGCQNCTIQYCYSHGNDGAGFLICQYSGARAYSNNVVRYNISQNDGNNNGYGGIHFYSAGSSGGITSTEIYNNTVFNSISAALKFQVTTGISGVKIRNNIFQTTANKPLITGNPLITVAKFENNAYWATGGSINLAGYSTMNAWIAATGQEKKGSIIAGIYADPGLSRPGQGATVSNADYQDTLTAYHLKTSSPLLNAAQNLTDAGNGGLNVGAHDFYNLTLPFKGKYDVGSHEFSGIWPYVTPVQKIIYLEGLKNSTNTVDIASNVSYSLTNIDPWLSADVTSASGNKTITFTTLQDNLDGLEKACYVILTRNDGSVAEPDTIKVIQKSAYSVSFNVTDIDNIPVKGAAVTIGTTTIFTNINGKAVFYLVSGNYSYMINSVGYEPVKATPFIIANASLSMQVKLAVITYKITFNVNDGANPIGGAYISIGTNTVQTSGNGMASFLMTARSYSYNVTKLGYYTIPNTDFSVTKDSIISVKLIQIPPTTYNITFKVMEGVIPVANAVVKIDTVLISTSNTGEATFNLTNGTYKYSIGKLGFDSIINASLKVLNKDTLVDIQLIETGFPIRFVVTDGSLPLQGATVSVDTLKAVTDTAGVAVLWLLDGKFEYSVTANGYIGKTDSITVFDAPDTIQIVLVKNSISKNEESISVFPNPTIGQLIVESDRIQSGTMIQVISSSGDIMQIVMAGQAGQLQLDISSYTPGMYFIKILDGRNSIIRKVIKE